MKTRLYVAFWGCLILSHLQNLNGNTFGFYAFLALAIYSGLAGFKEKE